MRKTLKRITFLLLFVCVLTLASCSRGGNPSSSSYLELTVWDDAANVRMVQSLCNDFAKYYASLYPKAQKLKITVEAQSEQSSIEKLETAGPAGEGPDVLAFVNDTLGRAVSSKLLAPNLYADQMIAENTATAVDAATYEGTVYGYPITSESQILIYKKSRLTASDVTSVESILAKDKLVWDVWDGYYGFAAFSDALLYAGDTKTVNFSTTQSLANLVTLTSTYKGNNNLSIPSVYSGDTTNDGIAEFTSTASNSAAAIIISPYFWKSAVDIFGDEVAMVKLPTLNGVEMSPLSGFKLYGVNRYSANPVVSAMLARFLVSEEAQAVRLDEATLLPTNKSLLEKMATATSDIKVLNWVGTEEAATIVRIEKINEAKVFESSLALSRTMPSYVKFNDFWISYKSALKTIWETNNITEAQIKSYVDGIANEIKL